jgi:DNA-binding NarL/FixJ family response regulator
MKGTVLFIEDEDDTRELLASALERAGYRCIAAAGAEEALTRARDAEFIDVVVTDIVLGSDERAGLGLMTALREVGVRAPVVVITAYADVDKLKTALNAGAAHFLEKPFAAKDLVDVVARVQAGGSDVVHSVEQVLTRAQLTEKERTVALHLLDGRSSNEIAEIERNSPKTIRQHVSQIYAKCGVGSRAEFFRLVYVR